MAYSLADSRPIRVGGYSANIVGEIQKYRMGKAAKPNKSANAPDLFTNVGQKRPAPRRAGRGSGAPTRATAGEAGYTAKHIEVLEGLEPVAAARACISAAPTRKRCITSSPR